LVVARRLCHTGANADVVIPGVAVRL
jgi:hypothetical protein